MNEPNRIQDNETIVYAVDKIVHELHEDGDNETAANVIRAAVVSEIISPKVARSIRKAYGIKSN